MRTDGYVPVRRFVEERERAERAEAAAQGLVVAGDWAIQCLRDVIAHKPVRGLDEALSGWEHARANGLSVDVSEKAHVPNPQ